MLPSFAVMITNKKEIQNSYDITEQKFYEVRDIDDNGNIYFYNDRVELHSVTQDDIDSGIVRMFSITLRGRKVRQKFFAEEIRNIKEWWK